MKSIFKSKKAFNDMYIIGSIAAIFIFLGVLLPFIRAEFDASSTQFLTTDIEATIGEDVGSASSISAFTILLSVLKMFFWTFGDLPFWLDAGFLVIRIVFVLTIARNIWIGGGG